MFDKLKKIFKRKRNKKYPKNLPAGTVVIRWNRDALRKGLTGDIAKEMIINGNVERFSSNRADIYSKNNNVPVFDLTEGKDSPDPEIEAMINPAKYEVDEND